jgi:hypothetical protein
MNFEEYKSLNAINASFLKACANGEYAGFKYLHEPRTPSPAMNLGTAIHTALLEPHLFDSQIAVQKKVDGRTIEGKAYTKAFAETSVGKIIIDEQQFEIIKKIQENAMEHQGAKTLLGYNKEVTFQWSNEFGEMKARLDLVHPELAELADVKSADDCSPKAFIKQLIDLHYDIQFFHYHLALQQVFQPYCFVLGCETKTGEVVVYNIDQIVYSEYTKNKYLKAMQTAILVLGMKECPKKYDQDVIALELPNWIKE